MTASELGQCMLQGIAHPLVQERKDSFLRVLDGGMVGVCGLGAGLIGHKKGDVKAAIDDYGAPGPYSNMGPRRLAQLLEIDENLAFEISRRHHQGVHSIREMAHDLINIGDLRSPETEGAAASPFYNSASPLSLN